MSYKVKTGSSVVVFSAKSMIQRLYYVVLGECFRENCNYSLQDWPIRRIQVYHISYHNFLLPGITIMSVA